MNEVLYFPKLGWSFNLSKIALSIGPLKIYWYGVFITLGFLLGITYISIMSNKFKLKLEDIIDVIVYSVIGGIIGARIYYVIFNFDSYKNNLFDVFKIWEGGIAIYGGIISAFLIGIIICKKRNILILPTLDLVVGGLILGQAIGRWGNFINIEAFGHNTNLIFGMTSLTIQRYLFDIAPKLQKLGINIDPTGNVHPCFFYESIWCLLGFLIIMFVTINCNYNIYISDVKDIHFNNKKFNIYPGELTLLYFIWYGCGRFVIEGLRVDSLMIGNIRISRLLSMIFILLSLIMLLFSRLVRLKRRNKNINII